MLHVVRLGACRDLRVLGGVGPFGADRYPLGFLTFVVSLEASFLSTFLMIGQNRQAAFQQANADHDFHKAETELKSNTELTRAIHAMTQEIHAIVEEVREQIVAEDAPRGGS